MKCLNCNSIMVKVDDDLYKCLGCSDVLDLRYPTQAEFERWKAEDIERKIVASQKEIAFHRKLLDMLTDPDATWRSEIDSVVDASEADFVDADEGTDE